MTQRTAPAIVGLLLVWGGAALLVSPAATPATDTSSVWGALGAGACVMPAWRAMRINPLKAIRFE